MWSIVVGDITLSNPALLGSSRTNPDLVINPGALTPGAFYRFMVQADLDGRVGIAEIDVTVNRPPISGKCFTSPTEGEASLTSFTLNCTGWRDDPDGYPLRYNWLVWDSRAAPPVATALGALASQASTQAVLGVGDLPGLRKKLEAQIVDLQGAATLFEVLVLVRDLSPVLPHDTSTILPEIQTKLDEAVASGDVTAAVQITEAIGTSLTTSSIVVPGTVKTTLLDALTGDKSDVDAQQITGLSKSLATVSSVTIAKDASGAASLDEVALANQTLVIAQQLANRSSTTGMSEAALRSLVGCVANVLRPTTSVKSAILIQQARALSSGRRLLQATSLAATQALIDSALLTLKAISAAFLAQYKPGQHPFHMDGEIAITIWRETRLVVESHNVTVGANNFTLPADAFIQHHSRFSSQSSYADVRAIRFASSVNPYAGIATTSPQISPTVLLEIIPWDSAEPLNVQLADRNGTGVAADLIEMSLQLDTPASSSSAPLPRCMWFDVQLGRWNNLGCIGGSINTVSRTADCICSHLTEFATLDFAGQMGWEVPARGAQIFTVEDDSLKTSLGLAVLAVWIVLVVISLVLASVKDALDLRTFRRNPRTFINEHTVGLHWRPAIVRAWRLLCLSHPLFRVFTNKPYHIMTRPQWIASIAVFVNLAMAVNAALFGYHRTIPEAVTLGVITSILTFGTVHLMHFLFRRSTRRRSRNAGRGSDKKRDTKTSEAMDRKWNIWASANEKEGDVEEEEAAGVSVASPVGTDLPPGSQVLAEAWGDDVEDVMPLPSRAGRLGPPRPLPSSSRGGPTPDLQGAVGGPAIRPPPLRPKHIAQEEDDLHKIVVRAVGVRRAVTHWRWRVAVRRRRDAGKTMARDKLPPTGRRMAYQLDEMPGWAIAAVYLLALVLSAGTLWTTLRFMREFEELQLARWGLATAVSVGFWMLVLAPGVIGGAVASAIVYVRHRVKESRRQRHMHNVQPINSRYRPATPPVDDVLHDIEVETVSRPPLWASTGPPLPDSELGRTTGGTSYSVPSHQPPVATAAWGMDPGPLDVLEGIPDVTLDDAVGAGVMDDLVAAVAPPTRHVAAVETRHATSELDAAASTEDYKDFIGDLLAESFQDTGTVVGFTVWDKEAAEWK